MKTKLLYHGLDKKDIEATKERKGVILSAASAFEVLHAVLEKEIQEEQIKRDTGSFDRPNYGYIQADAAGAIKAYRKLQSLIKLTDT